MTDLDIKIPEGMDVEEELMKILREEIRKEIAENGALTWKEICEQERKSNE